MGKMANIKFIELFAGIGGFRYGLERCVGVKSANKESEQTEPEIQLRGERPLVEVEPSVLSTDKRGKRSVYSCVWANEIDKYACQIYRKNYGEGCEDKSDRECGERPRSTECLRHIGDSPNSQGKSWENDKDYDKRSRLYEGDITKVKATDIPDHDLLVGGVPCQAWSIAGKRKGFEDSRGTMWFECFRIIEAKKPKYILLENVKGILSHNKGNSFERICECICELGYAIDFEVLNSKNFGVPQSRERVFLLGIRLDLLDKCQVF